MKPTKLAFVDSKGKKYWAIKGDWIRVQYDFPEYFWRTPGNNKIYTINTLCLNLLGRTIFKNKTTIPFEVD